MAAGWRPKMMQQGSSQEVILLTTIGPNSVCTYATNALLPSLRSLSSLTGLPQHLSSHHPPPTSRHVHLRP